jgi:hypothetical protein
MEIITIHPKTKEEINLFEHLAKTLKTPYEIHEDKSYELRKKPSDFFGTLSKEEGEKMHAYVNQSRI